MRDTVHRFFRRHAALPLLLFLCFPVPPGAATASESTAGLTPAADFELATATGRVSLHELRGKVVLVDFWASWCMPCRQSFPWLSQLSGRYAANDFVVVAINLDKRRDLAEKFLREFAPRFAVAFDPAGKSAEAYEVATMPSSYLVGRDGRLLYTHSGFDLEDAESIEKKLQEALAK
ncbi:MAG: TlpA disulfide reductase family protein [Thermoanaerobaculia bacterium]